ncbi:hypothetical protein GMD78_12230 [Ornithinibacillus sp. L9]|uniref:Uncharacterized protein n=1 Tax=Ornithinibacillus caprae TaxID=2678566 RepID=A0A6N8FIS8_9BACI|nr:hypothetical protein [Ornithinibacillus caprae]MUK89141.1 hypothetical protein [Ornithinibacillus caprae]
MKELGLNLETIKKRLEEKGLTDKKLTETIADVIYENNQEIEKNLLEIIDKQLKTQMKMNYF